VLLLGVVMLRPLFAKAAPAPEMLTIPVTGSVTQDGLTYSFTGSVTFPKPAPMISPLPGPTVYGMQDAAGLPIGSAKPGDTVQVVGRDFGATAGLLYWNFAPVAPLAWSDTAIRFVVPAGLWTVPSPNGHCITIQRPDRAYCSSMVLAGPLR
jgi:hypothetical protein